MLKKVRKIIKEVVSGDDFSVSYTEHTGFGHVTSNVAMVMAKNLKQNPKDVAMSLATKLGAFDIFQKVEVAGPGFINFFLTDEFILKSLASGVNIDSEYKNKKVLVEYTDPNPFKVFHIGHLMTNIIGESVARIYEAAGADVKRVNYQGDVGRHIAINIYAILKEDNYKKFLELKTSELDIKEKVKWPGEKYAEG